MAARPTVTVHGVTGGASSGQVPLPAVFSSPLRHDVVKFVSAQISKNKRQPYGVARRAGHQHSAESWGTGRAVARVPRISGGGTHRSGEAAFANFARGGRMFAPTKVWRHWHIAVPRAMRRLAVCAALAGTAVAPLVLARGHRIEKLPEVPLVVNDALESIKKTKDAVKFLKAVGAYDDAKKARDTKHLRPGKGKMRNRRYVVRKGPLVVYAKNKSVAKAFRNLPGVDTCSVERLNLLQLAPGGHLGRFVIWSQGALEALDKIYGVSADVPAPKKHGFRLPRSMVAAGDITRVIQSTEVQGALRPKRHSTTKAITSTNPLRSRRALIRLNPLAQSTLAATAARSASKLSAARTIRRRKLAALRAQNLVKSRKPTHEKKVKKAAASPKKAAPAAKAAAPAAKPAAAPAATPKPAAPTATPKAAAPAATPKPAAKAGAVSPAKGAVSPAKGAPKVASPKKGGK